MLLEMLKNHWLSFVFASKVTGGNGRSRETTGGNERQREATGGNVRQREATGGNAALRIPEAAKQPLAPRNIQDPYSRAVQVSIVHFVSSFVGLLINEVVLVLRGQTI